jgi:hypothetical protein
VKLGVVPASLPTVTRPADGLIPLGSGQTAGEGFPLGIGPRAFSFEGTQPMVRQCCVCPTMRSIALARIRLVKIVIYFVIKVILDLVFNELTTTTFLGLWKS